MAIIGAINFKDPRFQRAQARVAATPGVNQRGLMSELTQNFTNQQVGQRLAFQRLATDQFGHDASLSLANRKLAWAQKMHRQGIGDDRDDLRMQMVLGLGGAGLSGYLGKKQTERETALYDKQNMFYQSLIDERKRNRGIAKSPTRIVPIGAS